MGDHFHSVRLDNMNYCAMREVYNLVQQRGGNSIEVSSATNCVSPGTIQEILNTGHQSLIDQTWEQLTVEDMTRSLESLPSPAGVSSAVSPAGVGMPASKTLLQKHKPPLSLAFLVMSFIEGVLAFLPEPASRTQAVPDCPLEDE